MRHPSTTEPTGATEAAARIAAGLSILALIVAGFSVMAPVARAQSEVAGVWEINLDTQIGEATWTATFEQDGAALSGEIDIGDRTVLPLEGKVDGASISFTFIVPDLDGDLPINLSGRVDGATIEGDEGNFVWYGAGRWTGAKK
jgi:hypothetical protein